MNQVDFVTGIRRTIEWYRLFFSVIFPGGNVGDNILSLPDPLLTLFGADDEDFETDSNASKATHQVRERHDRKYYPSLAIASIEEVVESDEQKTDRSYSI